MTWRLGVCCRGVSRRRVHGAIHSDPEARDSYSAGRTQPTPTGERQKRAWNFAEPSGRNTLANKPAEASTRASGGHIACPHLTLLEHCALINFSRS